MTITGLTTNIQVMPSGITPTYNETIVVLESGNVISDNFKWIVYLYKGEVGDADYELITTLTILPNPDGYGVIDFHRHIENYITTSFYPADTDNISQMVTADGLKWSFQVTETFENPISRFTSNQADGGFVEFFSSNGSHPFVVGDVVSIAQDIPFTHASYEGTANVVATNSQSQFTIDKLYQGVTGLEGGTATLVSGGTRTIVQDYGVGGTTAYSFNGALTFQNFRTWDGTEYLMNFTDSPSTTKFLLAGNREFNVTSSDRVWVNNWMADDPWTAGYIQTDNGTYMVQQIFTPSGQYFINQNKIGPQDIKETSDPNISVLTGALPIVDDLTTYIKFTPYNAYPSGFVIARGETITMNIKDDCSKYTPIRFFYMDKFGSYLPVTFNMVSKKNNTNSRSNYKQNYGTYDSLSNTWGYTTYDRGTTTYDLTSVEKVTCTSDWLDDTEVDMVVAMLDSPNVYIQDDNGDYIAINITTNTYEVLKQENRGLRNYTITFEYAQTNTSQRG